MPDQARTLTDAVSMTDDERKVIAAIQTLLGREVDITTSTSLRDGLGLDRCRVDITLVGQRAQDFRRQAEIGETHGGRAIG